ncbi:glycosyltransferase [Spirosoma sp. KNUC1025]|uniref:glycosyltransferase n=1 Tax=Spirosoma sp. KNUC1025 TaxID=2894082 RepID=UPI00386DA80B|nr:glycosyltransferase [Spirosoma sp. KNUC1025]
MKRILFFFPLNPVAGYAGSSSRALSLLNYFKAKGWRTDFISKYHWGKWTDESVKAFEEAQLAEHLWLFRKKPEKRNPIHYFFSYKIGHLAFEKRLNVPRGTFPNHTTLHLRNQLDAVLKENQYDYIIISYAYWADLIKDNPYLNNAQTIIDTHDLLSSQHQHDTDYNRGVALDDELRRLSLFDQIWAISPEETYFFSQFFADKVKYIPMMMDDPKPSETNSAEKEFDLIYVATDNPHNLRSSAWFFSNVYPLLAPTLKICVIGTIIDHLPTGLSNVTSLRSVSDLNAYYERSRISICPMLTGTGVKVKVVEAMANGLPVVCSSRGTDGLPDKTANGCLVTDDARQFAIYITQLLSDSILYQAQSKAGRDCFKRNFDTNVVYKKLDRVLT